MKMMRNTVASGVEKYATNSRRAMIEVLRTNSCMAGSRVRGSDLPEDFIEIAALHVHLLGLDQACTDERGEFGGDRAAGVGQSAQPHPAVSRANRLDLGDGGKFGESLGDGFGPARWHVHGDGVVIRQPAHQI